MRYPRPKTGLTVAALTLLFNSLIGAETFRVHKTVEVGFASIQDSVEVEAGIYDAIAIQLPKDMTYIEGIELNIKIPQDVASWHDSIIYTTYNNVEPSPEQSIIDYKGDKLETNTIPGKLSLNVCIPLKRTFIRKADPYSTVLNRIPDKKNDKIFIRFQLAMKGVPQSFETTKFDITVKPVLSNKGKLAVNVIPPQKPLKPYVMYIDEKPVDQSQIPLLMETGTHHLSIISEYYRNESRTFMIDKTLITNIDILLRDIDPLLNITCPENAIVYLDDTHIPKITGPIKITQGEHKIKFVIGDYEIVKAINAVNGKTYTVPLSIEAGLIEEE